MTTYSLERVYAYEVSPQKGVPQKDRDDPRGGAVRQTPILKGIIERAFKALRPHEMTGVDFEGFVGDREHPVRDALRAAAFGNGTAPKAGALKLASRLSAATDERSGDALVVLIVEVEADPTRRRVTLLVLPRDKNVIQLKSGKAKSDEQLLTAVTNAFGAGSHLRKVARVEGIDAKSHFLSADIFDYQASTAERSVADFWVKDFLQARYRVDSDTGTKMLSQALRRALDAAPPEGRDAVFGAMHKASSGEVTQTSLDLYAMEVPGHLREAFFKGVRGDLLTKKFDVKASVIKATLGRRVIVTKEGIVISAPVDTVGTAALSVESQPNGARVVKIESSIKDEGIRSVGRKEKSAVQRAAKAKGEPTTKAAAKLVRKRSPDAPREGDSP